MACSRALLFKGFAVQGLCCLKRLCCSPSSHNSDSEPARSNLKRPWGPWGQRLRYCVRSMQPCFNLEWEPCWRCYSREKALNDVLVWLLCEKAVRPVNPWCNLESRETRDCVTAWDPCINFESRRNRTAVKILKTVGPVQPSLKSRETRIAIFKLML